YGDLPDSFNLVINTNHPLVEKIVTEKNKKIGEKIKEFRENIKPLNDEKSALEKARENKKDEEIPQADKDKLEEVNKKLDSENKKKEKTLKEFGQKNKIVKQLIDLALLSNNMLKGEELTKFVKRSVELIK
ncbi:MAG: molecular chaperone HtpG, partial [bacterium]